MSSRHLLIALNSHQLPSKPLLELWQINEKNIHYILVTIHALHN